MQKGLTFSWDSLVAFLALVLVLILVQASAFLPQLVLASILAVVWEKHLQYIILLL